MTQSPEGAHRVQPQPSFLVLSKRAFLSLSIYHRPKKESSSLFSSAAHHHHSIGAIDYPAFFVMFFCFALVGSFFVSWEAWLTILSNYFCLITQRPSRGSDQVFLLPLSLFGIRCFCEYALFSLSASAIPSLMGGKSHLLRGSGPPSYSHRGIFGTNIVVCSHPSSLQCDHFDCS